jgi:enediyne core biosynthesis thioesterase
MKSYTYRHKVGFEETNLTGNVYYVNHLRWQGRCRELFLHEHAPDVSAMLQSGLALVTTRCSCEYFEELSAFDEIDVRMTLSDLTETRIGLDFEYWRADRLIARGSQQIACMRRHPTGLAPEPIPGSLRRALSAYSH